MPSSKVKVEEHYLRGFFSCLSAFHLKGNRTIDKCRKRLHNLYWGRSVCTKTRVPFRKYVWARFMFT